jgi:hypothetical protein
MWGTDLSADGLARNIAAVANLYMQLRAATENGNLHGHDDDECTRRQKEGGVMIAVLEDRKGFRKTLFIPAPYPQIKIPLPCELQAFNYEPESLSEYPSSAVLIFFFHRWIEEKEIAIYREQ